MQSRLVLKSDYVPNFSNELRAIPTIGKLLHQKLNKQYFVCVPDFAGKANLPVANLITQNINIETFSTSPSLIEMRAKKDIYFARTDQGLLNGFLPAIIPFIKGSSNKIILAENVFPFDALLLFGDLTHSDPIGTN